MAVFKKQDDPIEEINRNRINHTRMNRMQRINAYYNDESDMPAAPSTQQRTTEADTKTDHGQSIVESVGRQKTEEAKDELKVRFERSNEGYDTGLEQLEEARQARVEANQRAMWWWARNVTYAGMTAEALSHYKRAHPVGSNGRLFSFREPGVIGRPQIQKQLTKAVRQGPLGTNYGKFENPAAAQPQSQLIKQTKPSFKPPPSSAATQPPAASTGAKAAETAAKFRWANVGKDAMKVGKSLLKIGKGVASSMVAPVEIMFGAERILFNKKMMDMSDEDIQSTIYEYNTELQFDLNNDPIKTMKIQNAIDAMTNELEKRGVETGERNLRRIM